VESPGQLWIVAVALLAAGLAMPASARPTLPLEERTDNCWMWGATSRDADVPLPIDEIRWQLFEGDSPTVREQGAGDPDGWSLSWWPVGATEATVHRSPLPANEDEAYADVVDELDAATPHLALSHLRNTSSGCTPDDGNPHPFIRDFEGGRLALMHNGTVTKSWLEELIGEGYLAANPPLTCPDDPVDSEMILIFLIQRIERRCPGVTIDEALFDAATELASGHRGSGANLLITDGTTLWALRLNDSSSDTSKPLHHRVDETGCWLAKNPLNGDEDWTWMENHTLLVCTPGADEPQLLELDRRIDLLADLDRDGVWCEAGLDVSPGDAIPVRLRYLDPDATTGLERRIRLELPPYSPVLAVSTTPNHHSYDGGLSWVETATDEVLGDAAITHLSWDLEERDERLDVDVTVEAGCTDRSLAFHGSLAGEVLAGQLGGLQFFCTEVVDPPRVFNSNPPLDGCACSLRSDRTTPPLGAVVLLGWLFVLRRRG
jgi:predicted glutamine amidotransferase